MRLGFQDVPTRGGAVTKSVGCFKKGDSGHSERHRERLSDPGREVECKPLLFPYRSVVKALCRCVDRCSGALAACFPSVECGFEFLL
jgi:hypothetical protein